MRVRIGRKSAIDIRSLVKADSEADIIVDVRQRLDDLLFFSLLDGTE